MPPDNRLPVKVWWQDESRFGLHTIHRRRLTLRGVKPSGVSQYAFDWLHLFGIVAPATGETFFDTALACNTTTFQAFLTAFAAEFPDTFNLIVLDNARIHHAKALTLPPHTALLFLPPYAPELNPVERIWLALKSKLAWLTLPSRAALQHKIEHTLLSFSDLDFHSLSAFPFISHALNSPLP